MKLREFFGIQEAAPAADDASDGVPSPVDDDDIVDVQPLHGAGPLSNGVPDRQVGGVNWAASQPNAPKVGPRFAHGTPVKAGSPQQKDRSARAYASTQSPPMGRQRTGTPTRQLSKSELPKSPINRGNSPSVPQDAANAPGYDQMSRAQRSATPTRQMKAVSSQEPFKTQSSPPEAVRAVHPWGQDEPLPDLPIESLGEMFGLEEMPRPKGSFSPAVRAAIQWAAQQQGEFSGRDLFNVYRAAGGQPNQQNDNAAYQSFSLLLKKLIAPEGRRPNDEMPLVITKVGQRGNNRYPTMYRWAAKGRPTAPAGGPSAKPAAQVPQGEFDQEEPTQRDAKPYQAPSADDGSVDVDMSEPGGVEDDEAWDEDGETDKAFASANLPSWMPVPDAEGSGAEYAMSVLQDDGLGPDNDIWQQVAKSPNFTAAMNVLRGTGPKLAQKKIMVAKAILTKLGKPTE